MNKSTRTNVTTKTQTTARTVQRGQIRSRVGLSATEENVIRMTKGHGVDPDQPLARKTDNPEILAKLKDIEAQLFLAAGRVQGVSKKQQIIDKLNKR